MGRSSITLRSFIATTGCLVAVIVTTQTAHAQIGVTTVSSNQSSVASQPSSDDVVNEPVSDPQTVRSPFKQSRWFSRVGILVVPYH